MMERTFRDGAAERLDEHRVGEAERAELAAFFRELGLGWDFDPEGLIDRLADPRRGR